MKAWSPRGGNSKMAAADPSLGLLCVGGKCVTFQQFGEVIYMET